MNKCEASGGRSVRRVDKALCGLQNLGCLGIHAGAILCVHGVTG